MKWNEECVAEGSEMGKSFPAEQTPGPLRLVNAFIFFTPGKILPIMAAVQYNKLRNNNMQIYIYGCSIR
jgi:hypothetical protein